MAQERQIGTEVALWFRGIFGGPLRSISTRGQIGLVTCFPQATEVMTTATTGPNTEVRIQGDTVLVRTFRETTIADLHVIFAAYGEVRRKYGYVFALYDGTLGKGMSAEARKEIIASASNPERETNAVATFGAPFAMRALVNVLDRALVTLRRKSLGVAMFATEAEARAYLDGERQQCQAPVQFVTVTNGGHTWPGGDQYLAADTVGLVSKDFSASEMILDFFTANPMP